MASKTETQIKDIRVVHRQAMEQSDLALLARIRGDGTAAALHVQAAYEFEAQAAHALLDRHGAEPTRSVLFHSAATLARDCGRFSEAETLIHYALAGEPPDAIASELHDLLAQVCVRLPSERPGASRQNGAV